MAGQMSEAGRTMGSTVGQIEKKTQQRVVRRFREQLGYDYLGDWTDREANRNVEENLLRAFLREKQGYEEALITGPCTYLTRRQAIRAGACTIATMRCMTCCATASK